MKRITTILFSALSVVLILAGCAKDDGGNSRVEGKTILRGSAVALEDTRAGWNAIDRGHWHAGDQVAVINSSNGVHSPFTVDVEGGNTFTGDVAYTDGASVIGLYPHTGDAGYVNADSKQTILYAIPAEQTYVPDGVRDLPMAGRATVTNGEINMAFHHLYAVVKIPVVVAAAEEAETLTVKSVRLETTDNRAVWAQFKADMTGVDAATAPVLRRNTTIVGGDPYTGEGGQEQVTGPWGSGVTLNCGENGVEINKNTPVYFHIAVMPTIADQVNSYRNGLKLSFELEGHTNSVTLTNPTEYNFTQCGAIYTLKQVAVDAPAVIITDGNKIRLDATSLGLSIGQTSKNPVTVEGVNFRFINWARTNTENPNILTGPMAGTATYIRNRTAMPGNITKVVYSLVSNNNPGLLLGFGASEITSNPTTPAPSTVGVHEVTAPAGMTFFNLRTPISGTEFEYIDVYYE